MKYDFKFFGNIGFDLGEDSQFYLFSNFAQRKMEQGFWYRNPEGGRFFSTVAMLDDGSTYDPKDFFPGGFTPQFSGVATDMSLSSGIRGRLGNRWSYDLSGVVGQHRTKFFIWNTVNPQLIYLKGNIPTAYEPGGYTELGNLSSLQGLYLQNNALTGSIPSELGNLTTLINLFLNNNRLTGTIPQTFLQLRLSYFQIAGNEGLCVPNTDSFAMWLANIRHDTIRLCQGT